MLRYADVMEPLRNKEIRATYRLDLCDYHEHASKAEMGKCKEERKAYSEMA